MEEDIKTIEHIIEEYKKLDIIHSAKTPCSEITALQNLIARYNELEEENKLYKLLSANIEKANKIISKAKKVILDIEQALSFARTGRYRRDKIQCEILENVRDKLYKEFFED